MEKKKANPPAAPPEPVGAPANPDPSSPPAATSLQPVPSQPPSVADKLGIRIDHNGNLDIASLAYVLQASKLFSDITSVSQGITKILVGKEIGLGPMGSVLGIHVIRDDTKNRTSIMVGAHLVAAKIKGSGRYDFDVLELDATQCVLQPYARRGEEWRPLKQISFTIQEAQQAGYGGWGKDGRQAFKWGSNWAKDPQAMCFARAVTRCEKVHFADLTGLPIYTPDELGYRVDDAGDPLVVKGQLVQDDMTAEDIAKIKTTGGNGKAAADPPRTAASPTKVAKLQALARDQGWPLLDLLGLVFEVKDGKGGSGYVDPNAAEVAWDAQATQRLLELIADDTYDLVIRQLESESFEERTKRVAEAWPGPEAEVKAAAVPAKEAPEPPAEVDGGEQELTPTQYDEMWAAASESAELTKKVRAFAKQLGYSMLRKVKQKDLAKIWTYIETERRA